MFVRWRGSVGVGLLGLALVASAEKQPQPALQLQLKDLGYSGVSKAVLESGGSMLTVHYLDSTHLLVSFGLKKLIPRLEGDPKEHDDRLVGAEVVELPSGKILAKTEWRTHDHGRYLWSLGRGRFLVRLGERLYTIAPLAKLEEKDPFERTVFPSRGFIPAAIFVSPDGGMVTVETRLKMRHTGTEVGVTADKDFSQGTSAESFMLLDFYRVKGEGNAAFPVLVEHSGSVRSPQGFLLPINADGYMWAREVAKNRWDVTFDGFSGAALKLGALDSSCVPRLQLLSGSEYLAFTCRGAETDIRVASYGFDGKETWEEPMGELGPPAFAFAPDAGRFAMSKTTDAVPATTSVNPQGTPERQEVRVYQNASGDLLLHVDCLPSMKSAQNFDLAPDGMSAAIVRDAVIAIYKLPALSKVDRRDIAEVAAFAPPKSDAPVKLTRLTVPVSAPVAGLPAVTAAAEKPAVVAVAAKEPVINTIVNGDVEVGDRTSPPTLLKPGEKAEYGKANGEQPR